MTAITRALISVSDKEGVTEFAQGLVQAGVEILSTGGTARLLRDNGIAVIEVGDYTGFPEMMDGRVKTLHPKIHGGILGRRGIDDGIMKEHGIGGIDLVAVNLYPFEKTIADDAQGSASVAGDRMSGATDAQGSASVAGDRMSGATPGCDLATAIENIDIGGPTMIRAAAKNHKDVAVVVDPTDYALVLSEMKNNGNALSDNLRFRLAVKTFEHSARYEGAIANYLGAIGVDGERQDFPNTINLQYRQVQTMRYGENPHQKAAFFREEDDAQGSASVAGDRMSGATDAQGSASVAGDRMSGATGCVANARQLQGKELSYNNIGDTDAALECVKQFSEGSVCVIVKHANPCGVAIGDNLLDAYDRAYATDPESAFGGIIAFNAELDAQTAQAIVDRQFVEVIIAPGVSGEAAEVVAAKKNVRLLECGQWDDKPAQRLDFKRVNGGLLVQEADLSLYDALKVVTKREPTEHEMADLLFTWRVAKFVKSNAIVYGRDNMTIGVGAGQMSRINSARIAGIKAEHAGLEVKGAVMASDAFFPFRDGIDAAAAAGIVAVIQPGGSMRDEEVIAAADEQGMAMVFTGMRHFRH